MKLKNYKIIRVLNVCLLVVFLTISGCVAMKNKCREGEYMAKPAGECNAVGVCTDRPVICHTIWDPVCGCDDKTYGSACDAAAAGVSVKSKGECHTDK